MQTTDINVSPSRKLRFNQQIRQKLIILKIECYYFFLTDDETERIFFFLLILEKVYLSHGFKQVFQKYLISNN